MSGPKRCLLLGAGGMADVYIHTFLPRFAGRLEVVGLVDVNEAVLAAAGDVLGLPAERRFTDMAAAFATVEADFCLIVIPPAFHRQAVLHAVERGLPILSEKPIADTWAACLDIYRAVTAADLKMQVVQNYRYNAPMLTMRSVLRAGSLGRINYVVGRFTADYRVSGSWGAPFRHQIPHALLVEGAVHHFDMLRNLCGADCARVAGWEWNPAWSSAQGEFCALYTLAMTNGVHAAYEGSGTAAGEQNTWHQEYYRAECEQGTVAVGHDGVVRTYRRERGALTMEEIVPVAPAYQGHTWIIDEFLTWLDGGPPPDTVLADNLRTMAMVFAAIEAARTDATVDVAAMISAAQRGAGARS